jgi:hypothetical protein
MSLMTARSRDGFGFGSAGAATGVKRCGTGSRLGANKGYDAGMMRVCAFRRPASRFATEEPARGRGHVKISDEAAQTAHAQQRCRQGSSSGRMRAGGDPEIWRDGFRFASSVQAGPSDASCRWCRSRFGGGFPAWEAGSGWFANRDTGLRRSGSSGTIDSRACAAAVYDETGQKAYRWPYAGGRAEACGDCKASSSGQIRAGRGPGGAGTQPG